MPLQRRPRFTRTTPRGTDEKSGDAGKRRKERMVPEPSLAAQNDLKKLESLRIVATYNIPDEENSANDEEQRPESQRRTPRGSSDALRSLYDGSAQWSRPNTVGSTATRQNLGCSPISFNNTAFSLDFPLGLDSDAQLAQSVMAGLLEEKATAAETGPGILLERKVLSGAERSVTSPRSEDHGAPGPGSPKEKAPEGQGSSRRPSADAVEKAAEETAPEAPSIKVVKHKDEG